MFAAGLVLSGALVVAQASSDASAAQGLAGVTIGAPAKDVVAAHKGAVLKSPWGPTWSWNAPGIGAVRVTADDDGNVAIVAVVPNGAHLDLPGAKGFAIASGHTVYTDASSFVESDNCSPQPPADACYAYSEDAGELVLQFSGAGNGPLREAIWGDRTLMKSLNIIAAGPSI